MFRLRSTHRFRRGLNGQNRGLRKAVFLTFKRLCLQEKTEFDRFSGMIEIV